MSWLNLNESLSNIKGQISSFASGVLADGIVNDTDPFTELSAANTKIQELQNLCASQDVEIASLRRQNAEYYEKISFGTKTKSETQDPNAGSNGENWFWDPPASDTSEAQRKNNTNATISDLNKRIETLELEKKDLIQSLEQLDQDCQHTTDKLVTLKDNLQTDCTKLNIDIEWLKNENEEVNKENNKLKRELSVHVEEIKKLKVVHSNSENVLADSVKKLYEELQIKFDSLQKEKHSLENNFTETSSKLNILQTKYDKLNSDYTKINSETISLEKYNKLSKDFDNLQSRYSELDITHKTSSDKIQKLSNEIKELKSAQSSNLSDDHKKLKDITDETTNKHDELIIQKQEMHKKYVTILTEMVKKYVDYQIPDEFIQKSNETSEISEFNSKVEAVLKLLLDFKWKTETLERKLCEISHEKSVAITEKNHEIEKLLHNSEILSQEVITKTQTIKDYEIECSELIKNNDLLIAELQQYKNNNGLQTISETNEDNLLLLETQLENANKRIRELELIINDMENAKQDVALETQTELDYIKKQLNMTGKELSQSKTEYKELSKLYKQVESDNKNLNAELVNIKANCDLQMNEKQNLESLVEKMNSEIENSEYKFTEANVDLETIKEELENAKNECGNLSNYNENLTSLNKELQNKIELLQKELDSLKSQIQSVVTIRDQIEQQNRNLTEKLQSSKMSETGLKLQNDTIKRELDSMAELNINFDQKIKRYEQEFAQISIAFQELKSSNDLLKDIALDNENISIIQKLELLKNHYKSLELIISHQNENRNEENLSQNMALLETKIKELLNQNSELLNMKQMLESNLTELQNKVQVFQNEKAQYDAHLMNLCQEKLTIESKLNEQSGLNKEIELLNSQLEQSYVVTQEMSTKITQLEAELNSLNISKTELVNLVTVKHQENIQYHTEIQRLNQIIAIETEKSKNLEHQITSSSAVDLSATIKHQSAEIEKLTDQNNFLKEKCEKLAQNLLEEQSNTQKILTERQTISEREQSLTKELERLRLHLVEIEDTYTRELLQAEKNNQEMQAKVNEIEQRERDSSTIYTSVSIRTNQQVETLQNQLQLVTVQRDDLQKKISEAEDKNNKQFAALTNLQCVLEQFQRDREKDIMSETERIRRQISVEGQKQNVLQEEINTLKVQLEESKQGLKAAARLTEQMEKSKQQVVAMKDEVSKLQEQTSKTEEKYRKLSNQTDAKVDKSLIKNLIVGFISANNHLNKDQTQILKIIATVLDFTQQDNDKLNLSKASGSWLSAILHPVAGNSNITQQSLSEAFVRFLENESQPKPTPPPLINMRKMSTESNASTTSSTRQTPILLSEVVLPTFADFAQNRNSSSILKDVLKEN